MTTLNRILALQEIVNYQYTDLYTRHPQEREAPESDARFHLAPMLINWAVQREWVMTHQSAAIVLVFVLFCQQVASE